MKRIVSLLLVAVMLSGLCSCAPQTKNDTVTLTAMDTVMQITVFNNSKAKNERIVGLMEDKIEEIEQIADANNTQSDVYRINNSRIGVPVPVCGYTIDMMMQCESAREKTDGCFDMFVMPAVSAWGFDNGNYGVPSEKKIEEAMSRVGMKTIFVDEKNNTVTRRENSQITFGGIAKGYLGDELLKIAKSEGVAVLLSLGGNIVLCAEKSDGEMWNVGIKNPYDSEGVVCSFKSSGNKSVVTSGAYERYFEYEGKTYHHIIDPQNGYPAESDLVSVTVIGENGALCDAYSTGLFVMGKEKAVEFAKENNDFDYVFITRDNEILFTDGIFDVESDGGFTLKVL